MVEKVTREDGRSEQLQTASKTESKIKMGIKG